MAENDECKTLTVKVWPISHDMGDFLAVGISLDDLKSIQKQSNRTAQLEAALREAIKRSNYTWSSDGQYTAQDYKNEGAIELAKELASINKVLEGK